ncbi:signal peptidase I [Dinghuibacter silviterrae]|uniref:Signal peptidase I n=1 Tax=Dinghuibacter silviterrae TaxID=1539049 RepID=A0A4V3GLS9_9BACT|nr:signal peptidase I [Dinghuibacter silviterrae]TDX00713.1 signal peptidase I [Dinghuibacter silviterrae]
MKKRYWLAAALAAIVVCWVVLRVTGVIQFYKVSTTSNEPTLRIGKYFFAGRWAKPKRFDFVLYMGKAPGDETKTKWIHRLCGLPGDTLEIRGGILYINGNSPDSSLSLARMYCVSSAKARTLMTKHHLAYATVSYETDVFNLGWDSSFVILDQQLAAREGLPHFTTVPAGRPEKDIVRSFGKPWNRDNFGPVVVPPHEFFVLGDSRSNAYDSRYHGFVADTDVVATVLDKR